MAQPTFIFLTRRNERGDEIQVIKEPAADRGGCGKNHAFDKVRIPFALPECRTRHLRCLFSFAAQIDMCEVVRECIFTNVFDAVRKICCFQLIPIKGIDANVKQAIIKHKIP